MRVIGRYALYDEIAAGGMATVHVGRLLGPVGFSRTVAIKRLHAQYAKDPEFVSMFLDEARLAARIRHPNVVQTLDVVAAKGELFLVMDYVQGESLSKLIRSSAAQGERPPPRVIAAILCGALAGLQAAHEARTERGEPLNIVHRDVSPQNILVGQDGVPRLLDFGVTHAAGRLQTTREGQLKGKLAYMAPEQLSGDVGRSTDVFAAAIVLWEALAARRLFDGENEGVMLHRLLSAPIAPPSTHAPDAKPLDAVVMRGLERDPAKRWQSAKEMGAAIEQALPLASASEVAAWVEHVAQATLEARANRVAEIESSSERVFVPAGEQEALTDPDAMPTGFDGPAPSRQASRPDVAGAFAAQSGSGVLTASTTLQVPSSREPVSQASQLSSVSISRTQRPPPADRRVPVVVAASAAGALLVFALGLAAMRVWRGSEGSASAVATSAAPVATSAAPVATPTATTTTATASATATASVATPTPSASASPSAKPTHAATAKPPPAAPLATATAGCDPPYALDAQGHKKWKPECIK